MRINTATAYFRRYQLEKCSISLDTVDVGLAIVVAHAVTVFLTSGSSMISSLSDDGC